MDDYPKKTEGTVIEWEQGKDLTKKEIKKKQKNKKTGQSRVVTKIVEAESFFNIFGSVAVSEQEDLEADEEVKQKLTLGNEEERENGARFRNLWKHRGRVCPIFPRILPQRQNSRQRR